MNTYLKHLSAVRQAQLETAIKIIVHAIHPEKIILFGVYCVEADAAQYRDPVWVESVVPGLGAYDLLVITKEGDRRSDYELQDILENRCRGEVPVTILVHDIEVI